jgi:hypothetical protein
MRDISTSRMLIRLAPTLQDLECTTPPAIKKVVENAEGDRFHV